MAANQVHAVWVGAGRRSVLRPFYTNIPPQNSSKQNAIITTLLALTYPRASRQRAWRTCCIKRANSLGIQPRAPQTLFGSFGTLLGLLVARAARVGAAIRVGVRYGLWGDGAWVLSAR